MADTDIDAVRKQKKAEYDKQYRLKRNFLLQQQTSKDIHDRVLSSLKMEGIRLLSCHCVWMTSGLLVGVKRSTKHKIRGAVCFELHTRRRLQLYDTQRTEFGWQTDT
jgi:hypothetical protein